jgi:DNA repair protein RecO (recombination protein O)
MNIRSTCGIVLAITEHGEADKLVTLYCSDLGRMTAIAKGAKKSKRRFVNKLEIFSLLQFFYRPPRGVAGLYLLSEAELLTAHFPLRTNFQRYAAASYLCELIVRFTRDNDPDPRLYALLQWALSALDHETYPHKIVAIAHLLLLEAVGYRPDFRRCHTCHQPVKPGPPYTLLPEIGALQCSTCSPWYKGRSIGLSVQTLRLLANAQLFDLNKLHRLHFPQQALSEALAALHYFTLHLLQQDVHSWKCLRTLFTSPLPGIRTYQA